MVLLLSVTDIGRVQIPKLCLIVFSWFLNEIGLKRHHCFFLKIIVGFSAIWEIFFGQNKLYACIVYTYIYICYASLKKQERPFRSTENKCNRTLRDADNALRMLKSRYARVHKPWWGSSGFWRENYFKKNNKRPANSPKRRARRFVYNVQEIRGTCKSITNE